MNENNHLEEQEMDMNHLLIIRREKLQELQDKVDKYIPDEYKSQEEKQDYIVHCVKKVAELEKQKQKRYEYER